MTDSSNDVRFVPSVYPSRRSLFTARISPIAAMKSIDSRRDASSCGARSPVAPRVSFDCRSIYTNDLSRSSRVAVHPSIVYPRIRASSSRLPVHAPPPSSASRRFNRGIRPGLKRNAQLVAVVRSWSWSWSNVVSCAS